MMSSEDTVNEYIFIISFHNHLVQDSKSQLFNGGEAAEEMQEHKRKIEVINFSCR